MTDHARQDHLKALLLSLVPADGTGVGNQTLTDQFFVAAKAEGLNATAKDYDHAKDSLVADGVLAKGKGRGGSVHRVEATGEPDDEGFDLAAQAIPEGADQPAPKAGKAKPLAPKAKPGVDTQVVSYRHLDKRKNNPEVGVVTPATDGVAEPKRYKYDPHIDPALEFDSTRGHVENLIDNAISGISQQTEEVVAWIDHALAGQDEKAMREVLANLRSRIQSGVDAAVAKDALEELKRLQAPYLNWSGKAERTSFEIDTVSLHVHERIDPATILAAVRKALKGGGKSKSIMSGQGDMFSAPFENLPLRDAIDFYKHERGWSNRMIAGDSLLVMNSLLQKESMAGKVQMIYIDPPYGIKYGSNFQPFVSKREVKDKSDADLTQEPEMIKAFRDTWELGIHSYLTYLRDRLLLAKDLLSDSGSIFVQISDENLHHVRELMDEIFGAENLCSVISFVKTTGQTSDLLANVADYLVWFSKNKENVKYHQPLKPKLLGEEGTDEYTALQLNSGLRRPMTTSERRDKASIPEGSKAFRLDNATSQRPPGDFPVSFEGNIFRPGSGYWKTSSLGFDRLGKSGRISSRSVGSTLCYVRFVDDFPAMAIGNVWSDMASGDNQTLSKMYVVQTLPKVIERCMLMTTDPGDIVFDPTCGSGTTAYVAEKWGRRWVSCDTSRVAITLAKQRLMTASYDYYDLKYPHEGLKGGFVYKTVPHVTLKSIANNSEIDEIYEKYSPSMLSKLQDLCDVLKSKKVESFEVPDGSSKGKVVNFSGGDGLEAWEVPFDFPGNWPPSARDFFDKFHADRRALRQRMDQSIASHADQEILFDQAAISKNKLRITGPFTVEAVPFPSVLALDEAEQPKEADITIARSGESSRQHQWKDELFRAGIRGKGGQKMQFSELEILAGTRYLHASGLLKDTGERVVVSFGPQHAPLEQRQVELALREAETLRPSPKFILFAAFAFDPEAAKDIDQVNWTGVTLLKAQMNTDLLTEDLKKNRSSNESFWLMGQPEVEVRKLKGGNYQVEVKGFDYFDTAKGELVSGGKNKIAMWLLDTDYDERSLLPRQVFFPMAGDKDGWQKLKKDIKAELNEELLGRYHGTVSLPFEAGDNRKIAVKVVDDRGIESLKIVPLD